MCSRCGSSRSNHHFNCLSLIHRCIASGDLVQADREIQNGRGIEPTLKDLVQQFWQIGARWSQPTTQTNIFGKHPLHGNLPASMWCSHKTNHPAGSSNAHTQMECFFVSNTFQDRMPSSFGEIEHLADGLCPARCHHISRAKQRYVKGRPVAHDRPSMSTVRYSVGGIGSFSSVTGIRCGRRGRVRAGHGSAAPAQTGLPSGP